MAALCDKQLLPAYDVFDEDRYFEPGATSLVTAIAGVRCGIVICEDGSGTNYVRGLTPSGEVFDLVRNNLNESEWAGACFSHEGRTLFVNIQGETRPLQNPAGAKGMTFAIWGPWTAGAL